METSSSELGVNEISKVIKILEVNFTFNHSLFYKLNFESIERSLRGLLKGWNRRGLTLFGKIGPQCVHVWLTSPHACNM